jgi:AraC-like DNA-binding protein
LRHGEAGAREVPTISSASVRAEKARDYLHVNFCENVTIQDLMAVSGLSRAHLVRAFVKDFGIPPHLYLNAVRIQRAKAAMLAGTPIGEVAHACGFADQSHLTRRFKGAVGIPPGNWLRQITGK